MKVSIIIPVYNVEKYIARCLDSVLRQTHQHIEVIIVNDGSPDGSESICRGYAANDDRIVYLKKKNGGLSSARNYGLQHITGDYVMFLDSDDWIEHDMCEAMVRETGDGRIDVVFSSYFKNYESSQVKKPIIGTDKRIMAYNKKEVRGELLRRIFGLSGNELAHPEHMDSLVTAWGKLYKRSLLDGKEFVDTSIYGTEDALWNISVFLDAKSAVYVNSCFYHYWKSNSGSLTSRSNRSIYYKWKNMHSRMMQYIEEYKLGDVFREALENRIALSVVGIGLEIVRSDKTLFLKRSFLQEVLDDPQYTRSLKSLDISHMPLRWKSFFLLARNKRVVSLCGMLFVINRIVSR